MKRSLQASLVFATVQLALCLPAAAKTLPGCQEYPLSWTPDAGAYEKAQATWKLLAQSSETQAMLNWSSSRGTLESIDNLHVPLKTCKAGRKVGTELQSFMQKWKNIFQINPAEWNFPALECDQVTTGLQFVQLGRKSIGGQKVTKDVLNFILYRKGESVYIKSVVAFYLPVASQSLASSMRSCSNTSPSLIQQQALERVYPYKTFEYCIGTGGSEYKPQLADTVSFDTDSSWTWEENNGHIEFNKFATAYLKVDPSNYYPDLLQSDANCVFSRTSNVVGFTLHYDAITGRIIDVRNGIGCVVC